MTVNDLKDSFGSVLLSDNQIVSCPGNTNTPHSISNIVRTIFYIKTQENVPAVHQFLANIAKACQLTEDQYIILDDQCSWKQIRDIANIKEVILMGVQERSIDLLLNIPLHYLYNFDERKWIKTVDYATMTTNTEAKAVFWKDVLKPHFVG